jgi:hypothetical protein
MRDYVVFLFALLGAGCTSQQQPPPAGSQATAQSAERDCLRIVESEVGNILREDSPMFQQRLQSCKKGAGYYNDKYVACIQQSPYSDSLECAYQARGIDRSERYPALKEAKVGQYGDYAAMMREVLAAVYKDADPKRSIDPITIDLYLERRDRFREIAGLQRIEDNHIPISTTQEDFEKDGIRYWVVRQTYQELQIAKIMREVEHGVEFVLCAQYGPIDHKLMLDSGLCAGLLKEHFQLASSGA